MKQKKKKPVSKCIQKIATRELLTTAIGDELLASKEPSIKLLKHYKKIKLLNTGSIGIKRRKRINRAIRTINEGMKGKI